MGELDVNPADLIHIADDYNRLAAQLQTIAPQAAEQVRQIIATHGPMGYPAAVGIATGLAAQEGRIASKAQDFGQYSQRFTEHAATFSTENAELARRFKAIDFPHIPDAHKDPSLPPPGQANPFICYIGTEDGDVKRICPPDTTQVSYFDKSGHYVIKNLKTEETEIRPLGPSEGNPTACWLPSADANRSICGPGTTSWIYPRGGNIVTEEIGPDGKPRIAFNTPPGPLVP